MSTNNQPGWSTPGPHDRPQYPASDPYAAPGYGAYGPSAAAPGFTPGSSLGGSAPVASSEERTLATTAHLSAAAAAVLSVGWLTFVGPLVVWLLYRDRSAFVRNAAAGAFNFALGMTIAGIIGWVLTFTVIFAFIGIPLIAISSIATVILGLLGAWRTWNGHPYTYPFQFRVLS